MKLLQPYWLLLFLLYVPLIIWYIAKHRDASPSVSMSSLSGLKKSRCRSWRVVMMHVLFGMRLLAIGALIVAMCRPQTTDSSRNTMIEGTDIVLAMDISGSMTFEDLRPNRMEAARKVAREFVNNRENDNMALVVFAGESFTLVPLTNDHQVLTNAVNTAYVGMLPDGTAIGSGLASAINRLEGSKAKSKSIILLTDGTNNVVDVPPMTAAHMAADRGIRVYTVGVGEDVSMPMRDQFGYVTQMETKIDEESLKAIADMTGGKYFRAKDENMLSQVFQEIDKLEKSKMEVEKHLRVDDNFMPWVWLALGLFFIEILLRYTLLRRIP